MKHLKHTLSILLAMLMLLTMMPMGIASVSAASLTVYVGGKPLADGNYLTNSGYTLSAKPTSGGFAHLSGSNLILYNYSYTGSGKSVGGGADCTSAVYAIGDLTVSLYGDNTFNMNNTADSYAIYTTGALTINEDAAGGNLTINNCTRGINCDGSVVFAGGTTTITAKDYGIYCNNTFGITKGKLTITTKEQHGIYTKDALIVGGNIAIIAKGGGITASGMYGQSGGIVTIDAVSTGIVSISTFKQTGGELYITSDSNAVSSISDVTFSGGLFDIKSTTVRALVGKTVTFKNMAPKASTTVDGTLVDYVAANIANYKRVVTAPTYSVIFYFGGDPLFGMDIAEGKTVEEPAEPAQDCKTFLGWYLGDTKYDFSKPVTKDIVLVATFKENEHKFGEYVYNNDATDKKDGTKTRSCSVCQHKETVTAVGTKWKNPFKDVKASEYFYTPVLWAVAKNITTGTSATTFSPDNACTRGQIVTFLWRASGSPEPTVAQNPFTDVKSNQYYFKAVLWAVEKGITTGMTPTTFDPNAKCTREQIVTFLWRSQGKPKVVSANPFTDVKAGAYYYDAVLWAVSKGITTGTSKTTFSPKADCTRGQIVTFLYRCLG